MACDNLKNEQFMGKGEIHMSSQTEKELKRQYLDLIAEKFDSEEKVATEIIHLESILDLPKGTEHFVSDLHGEYHAFQHVLRNGSGNLQQKIHDIFKSRLDPKK